MTVETELGFYEKCRCLRRQSDEQGMSDVACASPVPGRQGSGTHPSLSLCPPSVLDTEGTPPNRSLTPHQYLKVENKSGKFFEERTKGKLHLGLLHPSGLPPWPAHEGRITLDLVRHLWLVPSLSLPLGELYTASLVTELF